MRCGGGRPCAGGGASRFRAWPSMAQVTAATSDACERTAALEINRASTVTGLLAGGLCRASSGWEGGIVAKLAICGGSPWALRFGIFRRCACGHVATGRDGIWTFHLWFAMEARVKA